MKTIAVTATGTETGKTFVTALMLRQLRTRGVMARAVKPVASGVDWEDLGQSDAGHLLAAMGETATRENFTRICPFAFHAPLSPDMAAAHEGKSLKLAEVVAFCNAAREEAPHGLFIEGAGGVMSPICDDALNIDLIGALSIPAILVAGSYLGTISHTLTAALAMNARGIGLRAVIVCETPESPVPLGETVAAIARRIAPVRVIGLPRLKNLADAPDLTGLTA